jgi:hypothetical protein
VPRVLGHGYIDGGQEYFLALSLDQLPAPLPRDVKQAAMATLQLVHGAGVLHGDIELRHLWLLPAAGEQHQPGAASEGPAASSDSAPTVLLLDFGGSRISKAAAQQMGTGRRELQVLLDAA